MKRSVVIGVLATVAAIVPSFAAEKVPAFGTQESDWVIPVVLLIVAILFIWKSKGGGKGGGSSGGGMPGIGSGGN